ncbi:hypothetical protein [uncultured Thiodictyon sp.]|uniref:hypothetical protein n=1 Tax=uncultured Thiodictyon sp. TaxID=1846217 RepID=UPI0025E50B6B|nr:hypothetical protein [uncultured Thiodictyon sp.]
MSAPDLEQLAQAKRTARDEWEQYEAEANAIRAQLTAADRRARRALREYERARLAYSAAVDGPEGEA